MILLPFLEYGEHRDLDIAITLFVNNVLGEIVKTVIEVHEDRKSLNDSESMSLLRDISPATMFRENPKRCENTLFELYELICSELPQEKLVPRYRLFLFQCIEWYTECLCESDEFIFHVLPEPLRQEVLKEYGIDMVKTVEEVYDYTEVCFSDWDFLPNFLNDVMSSYLSGFPAYRLLMTAEELDEYVDLMSFDQREAYLKIRKQEQRSISVPKDESAQEIFLQNLEKALINIQRNRHYKGVSEDTLNDALRDHLSMIYDVHDQTRQGDSETGIDSGEVDLLIYKDSFPFAILETVKLDSVREEVLKKHINKLLVNYDWNGFYITNLIVFATAKDFSRFCDSVIRNLKEFVYPYKVLKELDIQDQKYTESLHVVTILERNTEPTYFHIFIVNLRI